MSELTELKDLIREKYGSQAKCAAAMGCSRQRLWNLTNGRVKMPKIGIVNELARALDVPVSRIVQIFLPEERG